MKFPKVSVVIPVYNGSNYLKKAIDSVLSQTYPNIELIVVNDGSNDDGKTEKIAKEYGNKIRYFKKENGGVASAVNMGITHMRGDYFAWLSHDDEYYPNKIEKQIEILEQSEQQYGIIISAYDSYDVARNCLTVRTIGSSYMLNQMEKGVFSVLQMLLHGSTILLSKEYFLLFGLFNETLLTTQDYDMWFRILHNRKVLYINEPLIKTRVHSEQGSKTISQHNKNSDELHRYMIFEMFCRPKEIEDIYETTYNFLFRMAELSKQVKFLTTYRQAMNYLYREKEPENMRELLEKLKMLLLDNHKIVIWGAGGDGRRMLRNLKSRDISVSYFADSDKKKEGTMIEEIPCTMPFKINLQQNIVIIAMTNYQEVYEQLKNQGARYIVLQIELNELFYEIPILKKHLEYYFDEVNCE